ncbi:ABC transporter permease subunit [Streptosporangium sp. NPDC051023]|uniref:ABC transporter permease n=1 Tax=Streptosporangium sp. NPDC051023 TaxID=3155410 RepID=UPI00344F2C51
MTGRALAGNKVLCGALGIAGLLLVMEAAGRAGLVDPAVLPLTSTILTRVAELAVDGEFLANVGATMTAWGLGLLLTVAVTVPLGLLLGSLPKLETAVRPLIEFLRPIPSVALIPLAILIFPDRLDLKIAVIFYASCWPVLINTMYGLQDVDPVAKETLRSFGFGPLAVLWRVSLPSTAPFIATGVRLAGGIALILAISAELLAGGSDGIGAYVIKAGSSPDGLEFIIAATMWAGILGVVTNSLFIGTERRLFRWHAARAGVTR